MQMNVAKKVAALQRMTVKELQARYADVFGERTNGHNKAWLIKRIVWRMQALAEGDLSERARLRAAELANDADLRLSPPKVRETTTPASATVVTHQTSQPNRVPVPGSIVTRLYKGNTLQVKVLAAGFEHEGEALAHRFEGLVRAGHVASYAELAALGHVTRARISR